ncbi:MAG TPA: bifunctional [glutamine synthetase] adenylyltransferase/[glutamine synthetase]-adenylyl-L-tyrosine phosphorylase [Stellaceae bacterium]|nr:bifunctional [glutamine synthetase] adenylyltransferase/[glutamine synthetase]-adenylyl-L-tyrosine phosphorylase [Stellaceae bacterium]
MSASDYEGLPSPADAAQARLGFERWQEAAAETTDAPLAAFMRELAADAAGHRLLAALFGNSPFLTHSALHEPDLLRPIVQQGADATFAEVLAGLNRDLASATPDRASLMRILRIAKRRVALLVAIADIAGWWDLAQVTGALSDFADRALAAAVAHLLRAAAARGDTELVSEDDPAAQSGLIVLAVGKLGARELNYSSDIDLIVLYDGERSRYTGRRSPAQFFVRVAQELVGLMQERTVEGYVFRTDLRLRPDPGSTPPALSTMAALTYYEAAGQNWERAALIKARPVAGDLAAGRAFLAELTPFLWRKSLDFAAVQDIHSIKRQINAHRGGGRIAILGHDVKLGRGGIREIEFFVQTQQLIWGGRVPALRTPATLAALAALEAGGRINATALREMSEAYRFLRRIEHRLQMVEDAQTHALPADTAGLARLAAFLGFAGADALAGALERQLRTVESHYAQLFEEAPSLSGPGNLVFTGIADDPETLATLGRLGFAEPAAVAAMVRGWHHGRYRPTRSQRARELLTELVPALLAAFGASPNPDTALLRFDQFLARLPAGVQLFSLLYKNGALLHLLAEIMAAGPRIAGELARRPALLDAVLAEGFFDPPPPRETLATEFERTLEGARSYEEALDLARRFVAERKFQIGVQLLRARIDGDRAGAAFADVAETAIAGLLPRVEAAFAESHGTVEGGALVVLGLGKLGSREMTVTSDLDLILVYDAPVGIEASCGRKPLPVSTYYTRLSQRLINALTALTAAGNLYEVDMRLRPSGAKGPVASSLEAFERYHNELAWTWEQMALTRARVVAGDHALGARVMARVRAVLTRPREPDQLVVDVADMRRRMKEQHRKPSAWDVKHRRGGLIDIEFIAQYLQLRESARVPAVLKQNTQDALGALAEAGALPREAAGRLSATLTLWHGVQGLVKLTAEEPFDEAAAPPALKLLLARGLRAADFDTLKRQMMASADDARLCYGKLIDEPAQKARARRNLSPTPFPSAEETPAS